MTHFILPLSDPSATLDIAGGKGLSLTRLIQAGLPVPAVEKLRQVMHTYLNYLLAQKAVFFKLNSEVQRLAFESQQRLQLKRHELQDLLSALVQEAIHEGSFRPVNPLLATRTIMALLTPAAYTTRPTGTAEQMMEEAFDIFLRGVQA